MSAIQKASEMLDRPSQKTPFRRSFDEWWSAQAEEYRARIDVRAAWAVFQAGYTAGHRKDVRRFIFKAGRYKITVWARSVSEAKKAAAIEADFRVASRGGKTPAGGWVLERAL